MTRGEALLAAVLVTAATTAATPAPTQQATQQPTQRPDSVTLITGDRVTVTGQRYRVQPGPGREVSFTRQVREGHLYVIPSDALPLLAQDVLDRRLFDVTQLLQWRYGDADTPDIPIISQGFTSSQGQVRRLSALGMSAARLPKANAARTWHDLTRARTLTAGRTKLWLDGRKEFTLDESVKQIGAPRAWEQGFTGKGVTVAVLDSGYDPDHPDLKGAVAQERNFTTDPDIRDENGHGTHVASIVASRDEKYRGVAPEANLAIGKVGGRSGMTDSTVLAGMEWAATEVKAKVVNMSLGAPDGPDLDPMEQAVNTLSERTGTLFVVAAGNDRPMVFTPGSADAALTVGAVDKQGRLADFSGSGPRAGDHAIKPDVTAPGVGIVAAVPGGGHESKGGTSMAAPHVAGAAAILAQRHPDWTGARLKAALIGSAAPVQGATLYRQGAGLIDLVRVLRQDVVAQQANVWAAFPYNGSDERTATRTITYANAGETPVTLALEADGETLKLPAGQITVPAGGEASLTLTIDAAGKAPGDYPGTVTARSGETVIRTLAGAYVEPESYDVTVNVVGRQGAPVDPLICEIYDAKSGTIHALFFQGGAAKARLPKGDWNVYAYMYEKIDGKTVVTMSDSPLRVDGDQRFTVDARQGRPVKIAVDDPSAELQPGFDEEVVHGAWSNGGSQSRIDANSQLFVVPSSQAGLTYSLRTTWLSKDRTPSPYVYDLVDRRNGGLPEDPSRAFRQRDLAKVTATYRGSGESGTPMLGLSSPYSPGSTLSGPVGEIPLPGTLVQYLTPGLVYESGLQVGDALMFGGSRMAKRGESRSEVWNAAVVGPSFLLPAGTRTGDELVFAGTGMFADGFERRTGSDTAATGTATLTRDGAEVARAELSTCDAFDPGRCELRAALAAGTGAYTLTASMRRSSSALSTAVESVWTFRSGTTAKEQALPLMAVRFRPEGLDDANRAAGGSVTRLPLWIERDPGSGPADVRSLRLEMSADDGAHWRAVPVVRKGSGWTAAVPNPRTAGFVSLRAVVTDMSGSAVTQTITRAYAVR
ncbi:S8 family serine peptidase [Nonomuraea sp. NPDC004186]